MKGRYQPRDAAISVELKSGTGPITAMCPLDGLMEIYKRDATFQLRSPENIDPDRTNPNAVSTVAQTADVGSANPVVARVLLQGHEMLKDALFARPIDTQSLLRELYACKEALLNCYRVSVRVNEAVNSAIGRHSQGFTVGHGRVIDAFPTVEGWLIT